MGTVASKLQFLRLPDDTSHSEEVVVRANSHRYLRRERLVPFALAATAAKQPAVRPIRTVLCARRTAVQHTARTAQAMREKRDVMRGRLRDDDRVAGLQLDVLLQVLALR